MRAAETAQSWRTLPLGEVSTLQRGYDLPVQDRTPGTVPIFAANGPVGLHSVAQCDGPGVITGRSGTIGKVHYVNVPYWPLNTSLYVKDFHGNHPRFIYWLLSCLHLERFHEGSGVPTLNRNIVHAVNVSVPSLEEQRRIADMLDRAAALRAKRRAAIAYLDELTQAIFIDMFGDPASNPKGWPEDVLGSVAAFVGGGTPSRARPEYFTGRICWATSKDMKHEFLDDTEEHITEQAIEECATKLVPAATILVVVKSKILAHHLPVAVARVPTCFGQDLKGIIPTERCNGFFIATALRLGKRWLLERARGINTEGLTLEHLRAFPLLMPPLALQDEFARRGATVDRLKSSHRTALSQLDSLFASLQDRAFRGAL